MLMVHVNGKDYEVEQDTKLMRFLRDDLRLTSVKDGCSQGACGTCTVLVDGKATKACIPMLSKLQGKSVVTVEGLSEREKEVYAYAFAKVGAVQCGFCIPGMVMCAKGLLDQNPDPSRVEAAATIRTNICRCTGYQDHRGDPALSKDVSGRSSGQREQRRGLCRGTDPACGCKGESSWNRAVSG